ncbi:MAG TPA: hypothetical protein VEP71_04935 [Gallionella sp.]|nr:hypothetical protein [Gallionella sp.]
MFKVVFCKNIWDGEDSESSKVMAIYTKEVQLPFAPQPNIKISWSSGKPQSPITVRWEVEDGKFVCDMEDEFVHWSSGYEYDFKWLTFRAEEDGWKLVGKIPVE